MTYRYIDNYVSVHRVIDLFLSISFYIYTVGLFYIYAVYITQWVYYKELAHVIVRTEKSHSLRSPKLGTQES